MTDRTTTPDAAGAAVDAGAPAAATPRPAPRTSRARGRGIGEPRTSPRLIAVADRRAEALALRRRGLTYQEVGDAMGIPMRTAGDLITSGLRDIPRADADDLRTLELERLDTMHAALWPTIERAGDPTPPKRGRGRPRNDAPVRVPDPPSVADVARAVSAVTDLMERRARMLGLDAPKRTDTTISGPGGSPIMIAALDRVRALSDTGLDAAISRLEAVTSDDDGEADPAGPTALADGAASPSDGGTDDDAGTGGA